MLRRELAECAMSVFEAAGPGEIRWAVDNYPDQLREVLGTVGGGSGVITTGSDSAVRSRALATRLESLEAEIAALRREISASGDGGHRTVPPSFALTQAERLLAEARGMLAYAAGEVAAGYPSGPPRG
jgi:hypothetical protein